jgi:hypothetical protein
MDSINNINETGGAGDWGTDKARARLQKDTPGQEITKGKKMKTFKDILNNIDESSTNIKEISERVHYAFDTQDGAQEFQKKVAGMPMNIVKVGSGKYYVVELRPGANQGVQDKAAKIAVSIGLSEEFYNIAEGYIKPTTEVVQEAMSEKDKAKRLKMIKQAVEKMNKSNMERAKKDALKMMKDSGMFDEDVELQEIRKAPQIKHLNIYGSEISGLRSGGKYYMAMAIDMRGKLMYKVIDEFGSIETIDLKTFAKRFG